MNLIDVVNKDHLNPKVKDLPEFKSGDTVAVHTKITEGAKSRIQIFEGVCIGFKQKGDINGHFRVRKVSNGIGVERVMACYIEQHNDEQGLIWDKTLAPFHVHLMGLNLKKEEVIQACEKLYKEMNAKGIEVLFDDRVDAQAGFKFKDADLLGMPIQVIVGDKKLKESKVEVKIRKTGERFDVNVGELISKIMELLSPL